MTKNKIVSLSLESRAIDLKSQDILSEEARQQIYPLLNAIAKYEQKQEGQ